MTPLILSLLLSTRLWASPNNNFSHVLDIRIPLLIFSDADEFRRLCEEIQVPCGEEILPDQHLIHTEIQKDYGLRFTNLSVKALLDKMVARRPGYMWEFADGVLLLRPRAPKIPSPLTDSIRHFVANGKPAAVIVAELARSKWIALPPPHPVLGAGLDGETEWANEYKMIHLSRDGDTLRQLLNATVKANGHAMWIYTYESPSAGIIRNFFRRGQLELITY